MPTNWQPQIRSSHPHTSISVMRLKLASGAQGFAQDNCKEYQCPVSLGGPNVFVARVRSDLSLTFECRFRTEILNALLSRGFPANLK